MAILGNMAKMSVSGTPGSGTITLGSAIAGFQTFAAAGITDQQTVSYSISDVNNVWEVGRGVYTASGTTLSRGALFSSNSNAAVSLTSAAIVWIAALAEDISPRRPFFPINTVPLAGTSSTGTGTITLAAAPSGPSEGTVYGWLTATGQNFVNGNAVLIPYTIVEYSDTTFSVEVNKEIGVGTLTLGASLTATTLARTTRQQVNTALNSSPVYGTAGSTAFSIGTAANVLVFFGTDDTKVSTFQPYFENTSGDTLGAAASFALNTAGGISLANLTDRYQIFEWKVPMLVKRASVRIVAAYTGGTTNAYARIYALTTGARPGKLLYDFGAMASAGTALNNANTNISSGASGNGYFLRPGVYVFDFLPAFSGGSSTPSVLGTNIAMVSGNASSNALQPYVSATATSGNSTAPDPANTTSYTPVTTTSTQILFTLKDA